MRYSQQCKDYYQILCEYYWYFKVKSDTCALATVEAEIEQMKPKVPKRWRTRSFVSAHIHESLCNLIWHNGVDDE